MQTLSNVTGWIIAHLPRIVVRILAAELGDLLYFLPTAYRRTILSNFHHAYPEKPTSWQRSKARASCRRLYEKKLFQLAVPHFTEVQLDRTLIATEETIGLLKSYADKQKPVVLVLVDNTMQDMCSLVRRCLPLDTPEIGIFGLHIRKKVDDSSEENDASYGLTVLDESEGLEEATALLKNNNWVITPFGRKTGEDGTFSFFMNRTANLKDLHQSLAQKSSADVLGMFGQRTGFWEGNLHVEKIAEKNDSNSILLKTNQWMENKLQEDESFIANWMWIHDRWKIHNQSSQHLSLDHRKSLIQEAKSFYQWDTVPRNHRIWIRMPSHLSDLVKWIPFVNAIRQSRQDAEITLLIDRRLAALLEALDVADKVQRIPRRNTQYYGKLLKLRGSFPDSFYEFTPSLSADLEARIINAPRRFGIRLPGTARPLLTDTFNVDPGWDERKNHQTELWTDFLRHFGLMGEIDFDPIQLKPGSEVINPLRCLQTDSRHAPYIGLICGAGNQPEKCWPVDYWVECIAGLMDLYPNSNLCLFGTAPDLPVSRQIMEQFEPGSVHNFTGSTDIMQFVMALQSCSVVISNDCGGLHLANALGVPTVGLYGITNPVNTKPVFNSPVRVVQPNHCPKYGGTSSREICLPQVFESVADLVHQQDPVVSEATLVT